MSFYRTQATIATTDNLVANYATNTWHFEADDLVALGDVHVALTSFYTTIDDLFSSLVRTTNGLTLTSYDMADPEPRPPVLTTTANLNPAAGNPLPTEVSLVMSFQAIRQAGVPQSWRRGRIYLPFLGEDDNHTDGRPTAAAVTALAQAGDDLLAAATADPLWQWVIYSTVAPGWSTVNNGWVDNEWDTQRRRGRRATSRTTFS